MSAPLFSMFDFETSFSTADAITYTQEHSEIPVFAVALYVTIVFYVPEYIPKDGYNLRNVWAIWNLVLSVFSLFGVIRTVPYLLYHLHTEGFNFTTCEDSTNWFLRHDEPNPVGFWVTLFIYSKIPELLDTVFLVLQKKDVIFLHWFHHVTVLLYCWHAFANWTASGLWFVAMNFSVHSIMYFYYFLAISGYKSLARPMAKMITSVQLIQMFTGTAVTVNVILNKNAGNPCAVIPANYKLGLAMYVSYFFLFAALFYNLYLKPGGKHAKEESKGPRTRSNSRDTSSKGMTSSDSSTNLDDTLCGVKDGAGFFHTQSDKDKKEERESGGKKKNK